MSLIEIKNLTHCYSSGIKTLDDISLEIPTNSIYGFLGPNGAGKTTTLRLLLGLLEKQHGSISFFGKPFNENRLEILKKIGSLIELPSLYSHLTALENLQVLQKIYRTSNDRLSQVLGLVGLTNTGNKRTGQFSLGMKQRLGIAIALLHNPSIIVLDEPGNGLDPNGIIEIRELLKRLNSEFQITIIFSSHLLSEVEKLVTHVGVINKGKMLFQGSLNEFRSLQSGSGNTNILTSDPEKTFHILTVNNFYPILVNGQIIIPTAEKEIVASAVAQIVTNEIKLYQVQSTNNDLESIFIQLTKTNQ